MRIKFCGLTRAEDIEIAASLGVEWIGFNMWTGSPRAVSIARARELSHVLRSWQTPIAVCVWQDPASMKAARDTGFSHIQVHQTPGGWTRDELGASGGVVIRAISVATAIAPSDLVGSDYYLVDSPTRQLGGSGQTFDWNLLGAVQDHPALILAGGLKPTNVAAAIVAVRPCAVDVASGIEQSPGIKDTALMHAFVDQVKRS